MNFFLPGLRTFLSPAEGLMHSPHSCMWVAFCEHPFTHTQPVKGKQTALSLKSDTRQIALRRLPNWSLDFASRFPCPVGKIPRKIRYTRAINSQLRNCRSSLQPPTHSYSQSPTHSHPHSLECKVQFNLSVVTGKNNMRKDASVAPLVVCILGSKCTHLYTVHKCVMAFAMRNLMKRV